MKIAPLALTAIVAGGGVSSQEPLPPRPTNLGYCYAEQFANGPGPYQRARSAPGAKAARIEADDSCIGGDLSKCRRVPLEPASSWISGARLGDWICVSDGVKTGWVPFRELALEPAPQRPAADWLGTWERERGGATLEIQAKDGKTLEVSGEATWSSGPDAVPHIGQLDGRARASGVELVLGDPRCVAPDRADKSDAISACLECNARLLLVGTTLIVADNRNCGGLNVNFDGLYRRIARTR